MVIRHLNYFQKFDQRQMFYIHQHHHRRLRLLKPTPRRRRRPPPNIELLPHLVRM
jgi:hypothetical protein